MPWGLYLLILTGFFSTIVSFYLFQDTDRYIFLGLLCASVFFIIIQVGFILQQVLSFSALKWMIQWGSICCIALVLCSLLLFLRDMQPNVTRFHLLYTIFPLLIIIPFFLVFDSEFLKTKLLLIYEGSALFVSILLYGTSYYNDPKYLTTFIGILLLVASFISQFFVSTSYVIVSRLIFAAGIIALFSGYLMINTQMHKIISKRKKPREKWSHL
jgi:hypothetical protein